MCMILLVLLGKVCLAWPPCPSYSYNFSILCLAEYSKDQLLVKRTHDILFLFLLLLLLGGTIALFQVLGVGEVAGFPRRDKSWWEAEHITPTLVALALLHQLSLLFLLLRLLLLLPFPALLLLVLLSLSLFCGPFPIPGSLLLFCVILSPLRAKI